MTIHHIFYIPTIFLLGFVLGTMTNESKRIKQTPEDVLGSPFQYKTSLKRLLQTLLVFILIFVVTHVFEIPGGVKAVTRSLGGLELFDKSPIFSSEDVYKRIGLFSEYGIQMYKRFTYTIDILFPVSFLAFLLTFARFVSQRISIPKPFANLLIFLPIVWFVSDLIENATIFTILSSFPNHYHFLGSALGWITVLKFVLLLLSIFSPSILIIFARKKYAQNKSIQLINPR